MKTAGFAALAAVVWGAWMAIIVAHYPYDHVFRHDVDSPVLALEMSRDAGDISAVLHETVPLLRAHLPPLAGRLWRRSTIST